MFTHSVKWNAFFDPVNPLPTARLLCVVCKDPFSNPWDLMVHAQTAHMINIYELGNDTGPSTTSATDASDTATSKDDAPSTKDASDAPEDINSQSATIFKEVFQFIL